MVPPSLFISGGVAVLHACSVIYVKYRGVKRCVNAQDSQHADQLCAAVGVDACGVLQGTPNYRPEDMMAH